MNLALSEAYIARKNKELREEGKSYDWNKSAGGYVECFILSREEALLHVLARELRHFWQKNHLGKRGKVWGCKRRTFLRKRRRWICNKKDQTMALAMFSYELVRQGDKFAYSR